MAQNDALSAELFTFSDHLTTSDWWAAAAQPFALGAATSIHATGAAITNDVTQAQMITYLQTAITNGAPAPNGNTCYLLYLPDGVKINGPLPFTAYHSPFPSPASSLGDGWAVVSRSMPYGGGETQLQQLTRDASHEVIEAATDPTWKSWSLDAAPAKPWTGSPWQVLQIPGPIESADLCEGSRLIEANGDEYQRYFSNTAAAAGGDPCIPPLSDTYYNVTSDDDWLPVTAGQSLQIPVTGWSAAPTDDWLVAAFAVQASGGFSSLAGNVIPMMSAAGRLYPSCLGQGLNDGLTVTVQIDALVGVSSGDFMVIQVESFRDDPKTCYPAASGDQFHAWLVGVYVP